MTMLVKALAFVALLATFAVLLAQSSGNAVDIGGWNQLVAAVGQDPFDDLPPLPNLPGPASQNTTTGSLYLREGTNPQVNCPRTISATAGTDPDATVTLTSGGDEYECWLYTAATQNYIAGNWLIQIWLSNPGGGPAPTYTWALVGWNSFFGAVSEVICDDDSETQLGTPAVFECTAERSSGFIFGTQLAFQIRLIPAAGTDLLIRYDGATNNTNILPPGWTSGGSNCRWDSPTTWLACGGDVAGFVGGGILYIGGLIWTIAVAIFEGLKWLINVIISFFGALFGLGQFIATLGGTAPQEIQYLIGGVFVVFMSIIIIEVINLFRGISPA